MKCPRCLHRIYENAELCPHCDFSVLGLVDVFGVGGERRGCLWDVGGVFSLREREKWAVWMRGFERRFVGGFFAIVTGKERGVGGELDGRMYGNWVLNGVRFVGASGEELGNAGGVLLVLDAERKEVALVCGYGVERFFGEEEKFKILAGAHGWFLEGHYGEGARVVLRGVQRCLARGVRREKWGMRWTRFLGRKAER